MMAEEKVATFLNFEMFGHDRTLATVNNRRNNLINKTINWLDK